MEVKNVNTTPKTIPNDVDKEQKGINVPNLRFPQYSSNWTKKPLKTLVQMFKGAGVSKEQLSTTGSSCILYGELYTTYHDEVISEITSKTNIDSKGLVKSKSNDIIIPSSGETAIDIATARCVLCDNVYLGGDLNILRPYSDNGCFISYQLNGKRKFDIARVAQGASIVHLHNEHIENLNIYLPENSKEQEDIVHLMTLVDKKINTQSKIIEDLETLKNSIWNHIYTRESINWDQIKLKNILTERKTYCIKDSKYPHATLSKEGVGLKTDRYNRDFLVKDDEKNYKVTHLNDICYNPANLKFGVICRNKLGSAIFSPIYITYEVSPKINASFIECILTSNSFINYIRKYEQGTVYERMAVNSDDFLKGIIKVPSLEEQSKIVDLMNSFEQKIKKEKEMLELYKKQKAYLLQNMFI